MILDQNKMLYSPVHYLEPIKDKIWNILEYFDFIVANKNKYSCNAMQCFMNEQDSHVCHLKECVLRIIISFYINIPHK